MCGVAGFISKKAEIGDLQVIAKRMGTALLHRGPDDSGVWADQSAGVALAHRRLSIIDLSAAGHQPMVSTSGRYVIVYNGEIYNHQEIRDELAHEQVPDWRGHSDTETLLVAVETWGLLETLKRARGMFAFALWDKQEKKLSLARDRIGEKPLYYGWCENSFVFGSELKALRTYPEFSNNISRDALSLYFRYSYIPAPYSIYKDVYKLESGCVLTISDEAVASATDFIPSAPASGAGWKIVRYWSLEQKVSEGQLDEIKDETVALEAVESALRESIKLQSIADVPLGAFLSGGLDSSLIVALMQTQADQRVRTFTIGFEERGYSEAEYAKAVAGHLGTDHTELYVSAGQALDVIPELSLLYDEPFADSSQIPTFLVAQMARRHVTVALSGDAGDELFGGYNRYFWAPGIWNKLAWLPNAARNAVAAGLTRSRTDGVSGNEGINRLLPGKLKVALASEKLHKLGNNLKDVRSIDGFYLNLVQEWKDPGDIVIGAHEPETILSDSGEWPELGSAENRMMYLDAMTYLPDDILCKVDRASMGVSLETRVPMLDHRVVELAWRLPLDMKIRNGQGKWALRRILDRYVPRNLIERPKQGFGIPLGEWLRGPLRDWAETLLDPARLDQEGFLRHEPIRKKWAEHLSGKRNWEH